MAAGYVLLLLSALQPIDWQENFPLAIFIIQPIQFVGNLVTVNI